MNKSTTLTQIATALSKAQGEIGSIKPNQVNAEFNRAYADIDRILESVRPILSRNGLSIACHPVSDPSGGVGVSSMVLHTSGEFLESQFLFPGPFLNLFDATAKVTTARKYCITGLLGISVDETIEVPRSHSPSEKGPGPSPLPVPSRGNGTRTEPPLPKPISWRDRVIPEGPKKDAKLGDQSPATIRKWATHFVPKEGEASHQAFKRSLKEALEELGPALDPASGPFDDAGAQPPSEEKPSVT